MLRPWHFKIVVSRDSETAVYLQIVRAVIDEIRRGRLAPGSALPGTREMAEGLGLNRKTVVLAYDELIAQGWLSPHHGRGTFISSELPDQVKSGDVPVDLRISGQPGYKLGGRAPEVPVVIAEDGMITFDDGAPDTRLVPVTALARAWSNALVMASRGNRLGYGDPRGSIALRRAVAAMLNGERGLTATPDNICIVRGSQMGIYVAARVLVKPGDVVVMEELSYPPAREAFRAAGAEVVSVGLDDEGMKIDELERLCRRHRVRAVYVTPHHQFPTSVLMPPSRRLRLIAIAEQFGFAIVEDDYDHEFHFSHRPMLPLASADRWGKVVYVGSMSKLLTPSLRVGYLMAPPAVIARAAAEVMIIDRQGDPATEGAVAALMEDGEIRRHTRKVMRVYAERREILAALLRDNFGGQLRFNLPDGGLAVWARFVEDCDMERLVEQAAREKLRLLAGTAFSLSGAPTAALRLGFGSLNNEELTEGVRRLKVAVNSAFGGKAR